MTIIEWLTIVVQPDEQQHQPMSIDRNWIHLGSGVNGWWLAPRYR